MWLEPRRVEWGVEVVGQIAQRLGSNGKEFRFYFKPSGNRTGCPGTVLSAQERQWVSSIGDGILFV